MYRRIFTLVFCVNLALLLFLSIGEKPYLAKISNASLGNLLAAVLIRNDNIINFLFRLFASMPTTWPLPIRRLGAKIYHLGGLHSGCAIFAVGWHLWLTIAMTRSASADLPVVCLARPHTSLTLLIFYRPPYCRYPYVTGFSSCLPCKPL